MLSTSVICFLLTAPPSYAECVFGAVDIRDDETGDMMGDTLFTPMYTYVPNYEFRQPPPPYSVVSSSLFHWRFKK